MALIENGQNLFTANGSLFTGAGAQRYEFATSITETLWNKAFPYQLAVVELGESEGEPGFNVSSYAIYRSLVFTLPVNPESLSMSTPFAINLSATLGGIAEQHGGAPFRQIQFAGTFGVVSDRPEAGDLQSGQLGEALGVVSGVFAGTTQAIRNAATTATSLGVGEKYKANLSSETPGSNPGDITPGTTGYYQFRALQRFLETYAEAKKQREGKSLRLVLFIWKDEAAYLVTPQSFDMQRVAQSPFEYRYSLRLQAWRRVHPNDIKFSSQPGVVGFRSRRARDSFTLTSVRNYVSNATHAANSVTNVLKAVRKDTARVFDTMRQVALFCSAVGGIVKTAASLPAGIAQDFDKAVTESWDIVKGSFNGLSPKTVKLVDTISAEVAAVASGTMKSSPTLRRALGDPDQTEFQDLIRPDSLNLSQSARRTLNDYVAQTTTLTSDDFRRSADQVFSLVADYADVVGLNDPGYDRVTGRTPKAKLRNATLDDFRAMHTLASAASAILSLVVNTPRRTTITTVEYVAGLANAVGIQMRVPLSKFAAPFPYGSSLERLAQQYLGDASRWMEIAELNELRAPYVDESGTEQLLAANGAGNILSLSDATGLLLGQFVTIWSNTVIPEKRRVLANNQLGPNQWQVTLDGDADLAKFRTVDRATIRWYAAGTVNSQQVIYIPSDSPGNADIQKYVPGADDISRVLNVGDVDGMLTESGDLVVTPDGDWPIVFGYAALVQWARVALNTPVQSLALHPSFGVDVGLGNSIAEASAEDLLKSLKTVFAFNPSFTGVQSALVVRNGPVTQVSLEAGVRGVDSLLPIAFDVKS